MEKLYKDIREALPKRLDSRADVQKVERCLQTSLSALQDQQSDEQCLLLLKSGVMCLIKVLQLLLNSVPTDPKYNILNLALDILTAASEQGKKCSTLMLSSVTIHFMDIVLADQFPFMVRMEVLSKINLIFESTDLAEKEKFVQTDKCLGKLKRLFQLVFDIGDYEFQVCIMEFLFRLLPRKPRQKYASDFIEDPEVLQAFLAVKDGSFEVDCRNLLNRLNSIPREKDRRVWSFPCLKITFGSIELQKPSDEGYSDFWLDVNLGSRRLVIFCENALLSSQASSSEDCWDTLSVWHTDILKYICYEEQGLLHTRLDIKPTAKCIPSSGACDSCPVLHIVTDPTHNLQAALNKMVGQPAGPLKKVSDVTKPLQFLTENTPEVHSQRESSTEEEELQIPRKEQTTSRPANSSAKTKASQSAPLSDPDLSKRPVKVSTPTGLAVRSCSQESQWLKVSVPSDMPTPASTASMRSCVRENIRRASTLHADITPSRKKVKTPVVTVQKPASASTNRDPRMTTPAKMTMPAKNGSRKSSSASMESATTVTAKIDSTVTSSVNKNIRVTTSAERGRSVISLSKRDNGKTLSAKRDSVETDTSVTFPAKRDLRSAQADRADPTKVDTKGDASPSKKHVRKVARTKFVPPAASCSGDAANVQELVNLEQKGENVEMPESPPNIVIPDSLPLPSQVIKASQHASISKRQKRGKDADSRKTVAEKEKKQASAVEADATKSSKARSQSAEQLALSQKDHSRGKTLRSSQMTNRLPVPSSSGDGSYPPIKHTAKASDKKKATEPTQNTTQHKKHYADSSDSRAGSDEVETVPSSFEEFKAPKSKRSLKGQKQKTLSEHRSSKQDTHGSQALNSTKSSQAAAANKPQRDQNTTELVKGRRDTEGCAESAHQSQRARSQDQQEKKNCQEKSGVVPDDEVEHSTSLESQPTDKKDYNKSSRREQKISDQGRSEEIQSTDKKGYSKSSRREKKISDQGRSEENQPSDKKGYSKSSRREKKISDQGRSEENQPSDKKGYSKSSRREQKISDQGRSEEIQSTDKKDYSKSSRREKKISDQGRSEENQPSDKKGYSKSSRREKKIPKSDQGSPEQQLPASSTTDEPRNLPEYSSEKVKNKKLREGTSTDKRQPLETIGACLGNSEMVASANNKQHTVCRNDSSSEENHESVSDSSPKEKKNLHLSVEKGFETDDDKLPKSTENHNDNAGNYVRDDEKTMAHSPDTPLDKQFDISTISSHKKCKQQPSLNSSNNVAHEREVYDFEDETDAVGNTDYNHHQKEFTEDISEKVNSAKKTTSFDKKKRHSGGGKGSAVRSKKEPVTDLSRSVSSEKQKKGCQDEANTQSRINPEVKRFQGSDGYSSDDTNVIRSESEDDDTTDFRFDLDSSNEMPAEVCPEETLHKPQRNKPKKPKEQHKEKDALPQQKMPAPYTRVANIQSETTDDEGQYQKKKTYSRKKPKGKTSVFSDVCQKDSTGRKETSDPVNEKPVKGKDWVSKGKKESKSKSMRDTLQPSDSKQKDQSASGTKDTVSAYTPSRNFNSETSPKQVTEKAASPPSRSLRKRQPKSYKETDSVEDIDVNGNDNVHTRNQSLSKSVISDRKFMFSKSEQRKPDGGKFIQKTFAMSISSIHTNQPCNRPTADPYSFNEEECDGSQSITPSKTLANYDTGLKDKSPKKTVTGSKLKKWKNMVATKTATFSWDEDDDDDNDADAEGSQESEKQNSGYLPLNTVTPVPKWQQQFNPGQKQISTYRQLHSQLPSSTPGEFGQRHHSAPSSCPQKCSRIQKSREKQHDPWKTPVSTKTWKSKDDRMTDPEESPYNGSVTASPLSLKVMSCGKSHPNSDQRQGAKHKSLPSICMVTSASSLLNKTNARDSHSGRVHMGLERKSPAEDGSAKRRRGYSPLDINSVMTAVGWTSYDNLSDGEARSSVKRKTVDREQDANFELSPLVPMKAVESLDKGEVSDEISPWHSHTSPHMALRTNTPVSQVNSKAGKLKASQRKGGKGEKGKGKREENAKRGFSFDSLTASLRKTALDKEHNIDDNVESGDEEDEITRVFTKTWGCQSKELFPDLADSLPALQTGTSQRKRKPQLSASQPPKKASRRTTSMSGVMTSIDSVSHTLSEDEDVLDLEEGAQPGRELRVTQPVTGITSLLQGFNVDMQKQLKEREKQVQELARGAVKLSCRRIGNMWTAERSRRVEAFSSFRDRVYSELCDLEQDVAMMAEREKNVEATYLNQLNILQDQRDKLQNRVKSLMECHEDFRMETEQVEEQSRDTRRYLEVQMKQDMDQLKTKLLMDMQQQQLKRVKDSCLKHFI